MQKSSAINDNNKQLLRQIELPNFYRIKTSVSPSIVQTATIEHQNIKQSNHHQFLSQLPYSIKREDRKEPIDVGDSLEQLLLEDGFVRIVLRTTPTAAVRPREILRLLGLDDLEAAGHWISRTAVELAP